jgi:hypothetical protein
MTFETWDQIGRLLGTIRDAAAVEDWRTVHRVAQDLLAIAPEHAEALAALEEATRELAARGEDPASPRRRWTPEDDAALRELAGTRPAREIARLLNRTPDAVRHRAYAMGLSLRYRRTR